MITTDHEVAGDYYQLLEVAPDANHEEIKQGYRRQCKRWHSDVRGGSDEHMKALNEAYAVLGDSHARDAYDRTRTTVAADPYVTPTEIRWVCAAGANPGPQTVRSSNRGGCSITSLGADREHGAFWRIDRAEHVGGCLTSG